MFEDNQSLRLVLKRTHRHHPHLASLKWTLIYAGPHLMYCGDGTVVYLLESRLSLCCKQRTKHVLIWKMRMRTLNSGLTEVLT